jgi:predicted XRE-type DNA-binding protein
MITNKLFRECLDQVSETTKAELDLSFAIADRTDYLLKKKGMTQRMLAKQLGKNESEISKWLTGRHNFTTNTLARLALALGEEVVSVP